MQIFFKQTIKYFTVFRKKILKISFSFKTNNQITNSYETHSFYCYSILLIFYFL